MIQLKAGVYLRSTETLNDSFFANALIFIVEYNAQGALGFIINRPFGRSLNELEEFRHSPSFPLYEGGPVDKEHLFFLHQRPDYIKNGNLVTGSIYYSGDFRQAVTGINNKSLSTSDLKIFVGYCGWDTGELEAEIEEGSWTVDEAD